MKIRAKLLLLEGSITGILFLSLILSVYSLISLSGINTLYRELLDKNTETKQLRLKMEEILYFPSAQITDFIQLEKEWTSLTISLGQSNNSRAVKMLGRDFHSSLDRIEKEWRILSSDRNISDYHVFFEDYLRENSTQTSGLYSYSENSEDRETKQVVSLFRNIVEELIKIDVREDELIDSIQPQIPQVMRRTIIRIIGGNILALIVTIIIAFIFGSRFLDNITRIKYSINRVSSGEFSHKLQISSNDEFGRLARDFNAVTEALWAKLESVQSILNDVGESISNEIDVEKVEKAIVYLGLKSSDASGAALYLFNDDNTELLLTYGVGDFRPPYPLGEEKENVLPFKSTDETLASFRDIPVKVGEHLIGEAAQKGEAIIIKRTYSSSFARPHNHPYHINSAIAIPIRTGNVVLGVLCLIHTDDTYFSDLELANAQSFCELAAISIDNLMKYNEMLGVFELNREIDIAAQIQQNLLPQQIPRLRHTDMSFQTRTCRGINGDFYDCYMNDKETILITICEVAGKGVPAALVITMIKTILKLVAKPGLNAAEIIGALNRNITEKIRIENIAALSLILYNQTTGSLSYASAGTQPMLLYRSRSNEYEEILPQGIPVGLDKKADYEESRLSLDKGDFLMLFTDGIPEARNSAGKEYGIDSLKKLALSAREGSAEEMVHEIIEDLDYFHRNSHQWDDQTIFALKREGEL